MVYSHIVLQDIVHVIVHIHRDFKIFPHFSRNISVKKYHFACTVSYIRCTYDSLLIIGNGGWNTDGYGLYLFDSVGNSVLLNNLTELYHRIVGIGNVKAFDDRGIFHLIVRGHSPDAEIGSPQINADYYIFHSPLLFFLSAMVSVNY